MAIMDCYPDKRAIENELGGKWELFYQYTFEDTHTESFEFPHDLDENESPLNLNGVMVAIENDGNIVSSSPTIDVVINDEDIYHAVNDMATSNTRYCGKFVIRNGAYDISVLRSGSKRQGVANYASYNGLSFLVDSIKSFSFISNTAYRANTVIKFYVLRGV